MTHESDAPTVLLPDGTAAVSLLGHPMRLVTEGGTVYEWPAHPDSHVAHCPTTSNRRDLGSPAEPEIWQVWYDRPALPEPRDRTVYVVPLVTALLARDRRDLVVPHGQRRTEDGRLLVTECTGLAFPWPPPEPLPQMPEDQSAGAALYHDVDRCEHGRHFGDVCGSGCVGGESLGNPLAREHPAVIAYGLDGARWVVHPGRGPVRFEAPGSDRQVTYDMSDAAVGAMLSDADEQYELHGRELLDAVDRRRRGTGASRAEMVRALVRYGLRPAL